MPNPPPDVRKLIDEFVERLLALAGGEQIPVEWKRNLAERLAPEPKPPGRRLNLACLEAVAYEMGSRCFENNPIIARTSPNKADKEKAQSVLPEEEKRRISKQYGCTVRTITNMQRIVDSVLPHFAVREEPAHCVVAEEPARSPSDEERSAVLSGLSRAIGERGKRKDEEELRRRKKRLENERRKLME